MTLLKTLRAHTGGLLRLKGELFWYGGRGWDGTPDRVCLILDAVVNPSAPTAVARGAEDQPCEGALLLIDGCPQWIWVSREDVELIT